MSITFQNDSDVIVYAVEKVISYARRPKQVFDAQSVWWIAQLIGLEHDVKIHIDNITITFELPVKEGRAASVWPGDISEEYVTSSIINDMQEELQSPGLER